MEPSINTIIDLLMIQLGMGHETLIYTFLFFVFTCIYTIVYGLVTVMLSA